MRSLYVSLLGAVLVALSLALAGFGMISNSMTRTHIVPVFEAMDQMQLEGARTALEAGGHRALGAYLHQLDQRFGTAHFLADRGGKDVVTGRNLSVFLPKPPADRSRGFIGNQFVVARRAADGRYWIVSAGRQQERAWPLRPYALVVIAMAVALALAGTVFIIYPLRRLNGAVRRFGRGDLEARASAGRRDEIGMLARSFNDMAGRIEKMITSERRLLQDISHELRSPLARLKLAVRLARTAPDRDAALDKVERDIDRLTALTAELIEMARLEGEAQTPAWKAVDPRMLIDALVEDCQLEAPHDIRCAVALDGSVRCDPELLRRALENVLRNAIRHSPPDAPITIAARQEDDMTVISIRDHGPGVPEDALDRIFVPFYRVDKARGTDTGGLGLGLAIARSAIQRQGGTISAANTAPGLTVELRLPVHSGE